MAASIGIVTNIELDHPDHYSTLDEVIDIFKTFAGRCQTLIGSIDCATVREQLQPTISYSLDVDTGADYTGRLYYLPSRWYDSTGLGTGCHSGTVKRQAFRENITLAMLWRRLLWDAC
jgi:hypothetical protein